MMPDIGGALEMMLVISIVALGAVAGLVIGGIAMAFGAPLAWLWAGGVIGGIAGGIVFKTAF